jgi:hypothetical protein
MHFTAILDLFPSLLFVSEVTTWNTGGWMLARAGTHQPSCPKLPPKWEKNKEREREHETERGREIQQKEREDYVMSFVEN